jgi:ParB/RepB/Spo0J family partition protein
MEELRESIVRYGLLQPITVRPNGDGKFLLVAGERRFRACGSLGWKEVPAILLDDKICKRLDTGKTGLEELALIENLHRDDLSPLEEARCYRAIMEKHGYNQKELAKRVSKSQAYLSERLSLLEMSPKIRELVIQKRLTFSHAKALGKADPDDVEQLAQEAAAKKDSVRDLKNRISAMADKADETDSVSAENEKYKKKPTNESVGRNDHRATITNKPTHGPSRSPLVTASKSEKSIDHISEAQRYVEKARSSLKVAVTQCSDRTKEQITTVSEMLGKVGEALSNHHQGIFFTE